MLWRAWASASAPVAVSGRGRDVAEQPAQDERVDARERVDVAQGVERHLGEHLIDVRDLLDDLGELEQGAALGALAHQLRTMP